MRGYGYCSFAVAALAFAVALAGGCAQSRLVPTYGARTFFETASVFGSSFSADESRLLTTSDASGVFNAYSQPVEGGEPDRLTYSTTDAMFGVSWFPYDDRFLYTHDQAGNELNHLYVRQLDGSERDLTPGESLRGSFAGWNDDRTRFWVTTNERDPKHFDLYEFTFTADEYSRELVFKNTEGWAISGMSRDGGWLALAKVHSNADSDIYLWDRTKPDQAPKLITPHDGDISHSVLTFTPDSRELYYSTNEHSEFYEAWSYDLQTHERRTVLKADWDVSYVYFSRHGRYRVSGINQDGQTVVTVYDTQKKLKLRLPKLPAGDVREVAFSPSETKMVLYVSSDRSPNNLHIVELATKQHRRLTDTLNPEIDPDNLVEGQIVRYQSFDGLEIPAILYRPWPGSSSNPVPGLVWVHGGPGGQSRKGYSATIQHLVNHGYAVLAVNNRGSSGYGKTFFHKDDQKHGEGDLQDCIYGRRYLESLNWVDSARIGIIGGSYGGYMTVAALAFEPDAFDVGVDIFGVTNWLRTLKSIPVWWTAFREALYAELGDPATDEERLRRISPLFHADRIGKPLLVVQGANDPRVLQSESDEIVAAVRNNDVPVEYLLITDEGHGFLGRDNRIKMADAIVAFLDKHLKGDTVPTNQVAVE